MIDELEADEATAPDELPANHDAPEDGAPEDGAPEDGAPEDGAPEDGAPAGDAPGDDATGDDASEPGVDDATAARAQELCAHLLIFRYLPKRAHRDLLLDDVLREEVRQRLDGVGLELAESYGSDHFGVRLSPAIESDMSFDWPLNVRLPRGAVALLVVLWAKLVLPRRIGDDEPISGGHADPSGDAADADADADADATRADDTHDAKERAESAAEAKRGPPPVTRDALYAEFGRKFGKTAFARYLGQLKNAHLVVEEHGGVLREGPLLDLLVDGEQMAHKLRDSVLWDVLDRDEADADAPLPGFASDEIDPIDAPPSGDEA